jgi:O-acetylhomoserine/O-acetylserine sulfhydrylase-like pyridoxal-dependent enzyme
VASGIASTIRFTTLLFGVAALGAVLVSSKFRVFDPIAQRMGLTEEAAIDLARRFSAGDAGSALAHLPGSLRGEVGTALRTAFESGFSAAAWVAVGVAAITLALTWLLMAGGAAVASSDPEALFVADE